MSNGHEDYENLDVLQNIEVMIVSALEDFPDMDDYDAMNAVDALIKDFRDLERGREPKSRNLSDATGLIFERIRSVCSWRMGQGPAPGIGADGGDDDAEPPLLSPATLSRCLKKVRKSMDRRHGAGGRRGYLEFIIQYFPPGSRGDS